MVSFFDEVFLDAHRLLPAIHRDWRGHLKFDLHTGRVMHWETGQQGSMHCADRLVKVAWDNYQADFFEFCNNILYDCNLRLASDFSKIAHSSVARSSRNSIKLQDVQIFIMHYSPLLSRRTHIERQLGSNKLENYCFITEYDREFLTDEVLSQFHLNNAIRYEEMLKFLRPRFSEILHWREDSTDWISKTDYNVYPIHNYQPMSSGEISLCCKHLHAMELFIESGADWALFLEDDAILCDDFVNIFNKNMEEAPEDWDIAFPGLGSGAKPPERREGQSWYRVDPPRNRASDSYILTADAAKILLRHMKPFSLPSDFELLFWLNVLQLRTYWWHPEVIVQASLNGSMASSLRD